MRDVDVVLLFEKAVREIDVACALKHILARRHGLTAEIIQQNHPDRDLVRGIAPKVVVVPFCYQQRSNNFFFMRWPGAAVFNLTWEQLFYPGNAVAKTPRGEFAVRHVIHNAWSESYADLLRAQGVPEPHIFVSGNPAYALYDEPYRRYFKSRGELASQEGLDAERTWVFFPENYNWAFYERPMLEQMVRDGQPVEQVDSMRDLVTQSFEMAMRWCAALARRGDVEVIIRPRPATPVDVFRRRVEEVLTDIPARISIIQRDTVRDWVLATDVVMSSYSTTLIEASIAGKPAFIVEPIAWPDALRQQWHSLVPRVTTQDEFIAVASGRPPPDEDLGRWARSTMLANGDPILLIADQIAAIRRGAVPVPAPAPWRSITLPSRYPLPGRVVYELRRHLRPLLPPPASPAVEAESLEDVAAVREVPDRVRRWQSLLDDYLASLEEATA
jgi:surface carbohydrate biosynthesis protein